VRLLPTGLPGVLLVEPQVHRDERGFFLEVFHAGKFAAQGLAVDFVQDNHSASRRGTLRGLHLQTGEPQGKLVRAVEGAIFDVAVDVRVGSPTFGRWEGVALSAENLLSLWIPPGFAHGFCVTSERAQVEYKCTAFYAPDAEVAIRWDDPELAISWPLAAPLLSPRDAAAARLAEVRDRLPRYAA
jgi:dTDP-4-dehydrorhamnose 3,5-epimerase